MKAQITFFLLSIFPTVLLGITTFHHDKPEESRISEMATKMKNSPPSNSERQKRLLPYINYYSNRNQQQQQNDINYRLLNQPQRKNKITQNRQIFRQNEKYTPFLESNALPGPFVPVIKNTPRPFEVHYTQSQPQTEKSPDFSAIYDTLVQLKQSQQQLTRPPTAQNQNTNLVYQKPQINYVPVHYYENRQYENAPKVKTVIETYTPTTIDITDGKTYETVPAKHYNEELVYEINRLKPQVSHTSLEKASEEYTHFITTSKPVAVRKPVILFQPKQTETLRYGKEYTQNENPVIYTIQTTPTPQVNTIIDEKYVAQKYTPTPGHLENYESLQHYTPVQFVTTEKYEPKKFQYYPSPEVLDKPIVSNENVNGLGKILKQLQNSNTLPHTLTPDNIDNSIRTLVKILNGLRKQERLKSKPIVVVDEDSQEYGSEESEEDTHVQEQPHYVPGTITQSFPANTIEGGTPGRPGIDYPALSSIPQTSFSCKTQRYKGFFGDPHTNCQVWHYCDLNGGQASFLCPNGTIFSQVALTCDWWYNVKCASTPQLYVLNERLYKYILPLVPKFPEDYSGPLVDRYLALKFQEMEEKMKHEKKKDDTNKDEKDDSDQLQDIQNERAKSEEST